MELLSPAGNITSAYIAFKGGADAIYIGGKSFSARASADNFTNEEIREITFYAHSIGKKVYVTLNTLLFQDEFFEAVSFAKFLYQINIDGIIVQDLGLAHYLHKTIPDIPLNASTQLNCHNIKQAKALIKVGFKRIVLAREANIETIKQIKALGVEVEVFGHGALCVSYSGNCLMSSFIGDRSGNRGRCAQPCRMRYDLLENGESLGESNFQISTKDLMTIDYVKQLMDIGVDSLKLEGRLKSNEYIYLVSKAYRHAIDNVSNNIYLKEDKNDLVKIFNRQFTKGYLFDESPFELLNNMTSSHQGELIGKVVETYKNRVAIKLSKTLNRLDGIRFNGKEQFGLTVEKMFLNREPVEIAFKGQTIELAGIDNPIRLKGLEVIKTKDIALINKIEEEIKDSLKVDVIGNFKARLDMPIELELAFNNEIVKVQGEKPQIATGNGTPKERIINQLSKSSNYPYQIKVIEMDYEPCFIPISAINDLRNKAFEELKNKLIKTNMINENEYISKKVNFNNYYQIRALVETGEQYNASNDLGVISYSHFDKENKKEERITYSSDFNYTNELLNFIIEKENSGNLIASEYCNITNSYALDCFYEFGFNECILSVELDLNSINALISDYKERHGNQPNVGLVIYGKLDMMIMRSCPIGTYYHNQNIHCNRCHNFRYELLDRTSTKYQLIGDSNCNVRVLNDKPLYLLEMQEKIKQLGISVGYLLFTDEDKEKVEDIINHCYLEEKDYSSFYTKGHFNKRPL